MRNLDELAQDLARLDQLVFMVMAQRMNVAREVEAFKRDRGMPILRREVENQRIEHVRNFAAGLGLDPNFAHCIQYAMMTEACRVQLEQLQSQAEKPIVVREDEAYYAELKSNLRLLTASWAPEYDRKYEEAYPSTKRYLAYEWGHISRNLAMCPQDGLVIDLGCATGLSTQRLTKASSRVIGYDLSEEMVAEAKRKYTSLRPEMNFVVQDLEEGIPLPDASVRFALMNLGTASDVRNLDAVLSELSRVLVSGGRFLLSFYNAEAMVYQWRLLPWGIPLAAQIDVTSRCLQVHDFEGRSHSIYARPYTITELESVFPSGLAVDRCLSYPTLASFLPGEIFESDVVSDSIAQIDTQLAETNMGAYIIVTGKRL